nr:hypothetical protein CFP56_63276 [Quercus suber]
MDAEGCEVITCERNNQTFEQKSGIFTRMGPDGQQEEARGVYDNSTTIGNADCRDLCWNNCDCLGYYRYEGTGCRYWEGNLTFVPDNGISRSRVLKYVLTKEDTSNKVDVERREEIHLLELTTPDRLLDADSLEKDGNARHNIKVFSFACIAAATNNFSPETKLGEGGFGPVYKTPWMLLSRRGKNVDLRNKCHFSELNLPPEKILEAAVALLVEFQGKSDTKPKRKKTQTQCWSPPAQGTYKANYDGAYFAEEEKSGIRVVVRNELGQVMGSLAEKIEMPSTVEVLEAMVARRAMVFMEELGLRHAIFEGDSKLVVKALVGDCPNWSSIRHIVKDCKFLMGLFQTCFFSHVRWQSNGVAHALARRVRKSSHLSVWMESVPPDISYLVYVDVTP